VYAIKVVAGELAEIVEQYQCIYF